MQSNGIHDKFQAPSKPSSAYSLWTVSNVIMGLFFALAALVQINDQGAFLWVIIYSVPSFLSFCVAYSPEVTDKRWWTIAMFIHLFFCFVKIIFLLGQLIFWLQDRFINPLRYKEGRELAGIIIVSVWLAICKTHKNVVSWSSGSLTLTLITWVVLIVGVLPLAFWGMCCVHPFAHCQDMW